MKFYNEILMVPREKIRPNRWNPNFMDDDTHESLGNTLGKFGVFGGILCRHLQPAKQDDYWEIVDGEQRWRELSKTDEPLFPVSEWEGTDEEAMTLTIALNALRGQNDVTRLAEMVKRMPDPSVLVKYAGLDKNYVQNFASGIDWAKIISTPIADGSGGQGDASSTLRTAFVNFLFSLPRAEANKLRAALDAIKAETGVTEDEQAIMLLVNELPIAPSKEWGRVVFLVHVTQQALIAQAIDAIAQTLKGANTHGRALELMAADFLAGGGLTLTEADLVVPAVKTKSKLKGRQNGRH